MVLNPQIIRNPVLRAGRLLVWRLTSKFIAEETKTLKPVILPTATQPPKGWAEADTTMFYHVTYFEFSI